MDREPQGSLIFGVVLLAAGRSSRMGAPKLLLPWAGTSVLAHLIGRWTTLGAVQIGVVTASEDAALSQELERVASPITRRIMNPAPQRGMFSSIQCAAEWPGWQPILLRWVIALGDQPHLRITSLERLLSFAKARPDQICQPSHAGRPRHPVLLPKRHFRELPQTAASTLKEFLSLHQPVALCEIDDPGLDIDLDRPEDYERALKISGMPSR